MLSVITVVRNDFNGLKKTIESVELQTGIDIEHLIIDGGSTDGSAKVAAEKNLIDIPSFEDGGIYQGMQRGVDLASGEYLLFLNSGDVFIGTKFVSDAFLRLHADKGHWGYGPMIERNLRGGFSYTSVNADNSILKVAQRKSYIPFPAVIMSRRLVNDIGGFSFNYHIAGDFDLLVRLAQVSTPITWDVPFTLFSAGGISYTKAPVAWKEEHQIRVARMGLTGSAKLNSYLIYQRRKLKGVLGKALDYGFSLAKIPNSCHWREGRKISVPNEFLQIISN